MRTAIFFVCVSGGKGQAMRRINVGCGMDIREGWDNLDSHTAYGANIIHDLNKLPLSIPNETYDHTQASHVIEDFTETLPLINELVRITKTNGTLTIEVPNETCAWDNPAHKKAFTAISFIFLCDLQAYNQKTKLKIKKIIYYLPHTNTIQSRAISFINPAVWNIIGYRIMNHTFLKYLFPYVWIRIEFQKVKK